jgi:PTH1 family peptidyl-tRNA hydrolase
MKDLKISKENVLVVTDDIAWPFGKLRMRAKGSNAGHNGLKDIELTLGGNDYARLRFGVGSEFTQGRQVDYVLGNFESAEMDVLTERIDKACEMILSFCTLGIQRTMSLHNE